MRRPTDPPITFNPLTIEHGSDTIKIMPKMRQCPICRAPAKGHQDDPPQVPHPRRMSVRRTFLFACDHRAVCEADAPEDESDSWR